jgi:glycosyltransferase involved in cell wall biosynthesis
MKVCLPCPGLEHVQRGYETYARELFNALKDHGEVHLVKSSGRRGRREHVVPALRRTSRCFGILPPKYQTEYRRFQAECWTFAFSMVPLLMREKFELIHFSEVPLGMALKWLRSCFGFQYRLLYSNGGPWPPWDCARFDAVQQVSPEHQAAGRKFGLPEKSSFLVPYGTDGSRLQASVGEAADARRQLGIPEKSFVVLSLAALNRQHKRVDWLIHEFAKLEDADVFLLLAGNREPETPELEELALRLLPRKNYRFLQVPYAEVPRLLHAADAFVLCSLVEGFGRVLTEAMGAGLPVLVHPHQTACWIVEHQDSLVDMTTEGRLALKLDELLKSPELRQSIGQRNLTMFKRFEWDALVPEYLRMYERVCSQA